MEKFSEEKYSTASALPSPLQALTTEESNRLTATTTITGCPSSLPNSYTSGI